MSEVRKITFQLAAPSRKYPAGKVAFGFFTLIDGLVQLTDPQGNPAGLETGREYRHKLTEGEDAKAWAVKLSKQLRLALQDKSGSGNSDFNAPLNYQKTGWM